MENVTVSTKSIQDVVTPKDFIAKINQLWPCNFDLAATKENTRFPLYFCKENNSLNQDWNAVMRFPKYLWLNPPFKAVTPWMKKCAIESLQGTRIVSLTLASRGTKWYHNFVKPYALSLVLLKRLKFEEHSDFYPKELMLNIFGTGQTGEGYFNF